jgi:hypothetical protein
MQLVQYSDLSDDLSPQAFNSWFAEMARRDDYLSYYTGQVFSETIPVEVKNGEEEPEKYPVGINLVKMLCIAQADSEFGEWEEDIVKFEPRQDAEVTVSEKAAAELAQTILRSSNANVMLWENALDRNIYGGGAIKISFDKTVPGFIRWSRLPYDAFFPIFDPDDPDNILEAYMIIAMTRDQAKARYGLDTSKDIIFRIEHWDRERYETKLDGKRIDQFSGRNPYGIAPFVYIPRIRSTSFWGDSLTEEIMRPQDELNSRVADVGEALWYNSHPIKYGYNLPKKFNSMNFPVGPNEFWDLGRTIGQSPEPKVGVLEAKTPVPKEAFDYFKFIYDWSRTSVFAPPIAFGEDNGGGQRSGITLEIRMWPLIKATRRSRAYLSAGLQRAMKISAIMLQQKDPPGISGNALSAILKNGLTPRFAPIMPRDQAAIVDEVQKRMSTNPPTISLETAVKKLSDGTSEVDRIRTMLDDDELYKRAMVQSAFGGPDSAAGNAPGGNNGQ